MFWADRATAQMRREANMRALQRAQERERDAIEEFRKAQEQRMAVDSVDRLRQQVKELQDLLRHEKERATMFRKQRDDLQARLDEIGDIAGR